jgi:hypothetical protein
MVSPWLENGTVTSFIDSHHNLNGNHRLQLVRVSKVLLIFMLNYARSATLQPACAIVGTLTLLTRMNILRPTTEVHSQSIVHGDLSGVRLI